MELKVEGVSEEEYGLWMNGGKQTRIPAINKQQSQVLLLGFDMEKVKNFAIHLHCTTHAIFVKVNNDKEYDTYREHLITLIKMLVLDDSTPDRQVMVFIVSAKHEDYKNELWSFFNMSTRYLRIQHFGEYWALLNNLAMIFPGVTITEHYKRAVKLLRKKINSLRA
ncbi:hypothetical protein [Tatumella sp. UBA2305]|uniref:hypothetical protein n=1 Tax=Tatumella sp. UBA2305 TaxID=1947647 RepID=UPI0025E8125E|nr:hypothetical protein [Tatumella sp. UBA2305]